MGKVPLALQENRDVFNQLAKYVNLTKEYDRGAP